MLFLASAAMVLAGLAGLRFQPYHPVRFGFFDLKIYRQAAQLVAKGGPLFTAKLRYGFGFTYPPIAALLFLWLGVLPLHVDELAVALANIGLVVVIARCTLRLGRTPRDETQPPRTRAAWVAAAVALWVEPVRSAMGLGQIDLSIAALVLVDLTRGGRSRWGGAGIGAAAALKLTPLIFLPYLVLTGRWRMAARALGAFLLSIAFAFVVLPRDARAYWDGAMFQTSRVTGHRHLAGRGPANQSLRGLLLRMAPEVPDRTEIWLLACLLIAGTGLLLAVRAGRRGDEAWGFVLTAITGLLICPVSWTHHWVIAVPGVLLLMTSPRRSRLGRALTVAAALFALGSSAIWIVILKHPVGAHLGVGGFLLGDLYVLAGLGTIVVAGLMEFHPAIERGVRMIAGRIARRGRCAPDRACEPFPPPLRAMRPHELSAAD